MNRIRVLLASALMLAGCSHSRVPLHTFSHSTYPQQSTARVFQEAEQVLQAYFRVATSDITRGVIVSAPQETSESRDPNTLMQPLSTPRSVRRVAELRIEPRGAGVRVRCQVRLQTNDYTQRKLLASQGTLQDDHLQTPLEETQGYDIENHAAWSTTGYDRRLEREILAALSERLTGKVDAPTNRDTNNGR